MSKPLVSVISPCYNVAPYIGRFLDSLLAQTYKKLELILVNDGSTDNTGNIIEKYIPLLKDQGYKVIYIEQKNGGQSSAINNALKLVTGKFLTWPDSDNWLTPDSIEKRVIFLQKHPDVGMVRWRVESVDSETGDSKGILGREEATAPFLIKGGFEQLFFSHTWFAPVGYMIQTDFFDKVVKNREIYVTQQGGQNWQMMLPMAHAYPFWQIPDVLGYYRVRSDSHSRVAKTCDHKIEIEYICEQIIVETVRNLSIDNEIINCVKFDFAWKRFIHATQSRNIYHILKYYFLLVLKSRSFSNYKKVGKLFLHMIGLLYKCFKYSC